MVTYVLHAEQLNGGAQNSGGGEQVLNMTPGLDVPKNATTPDIIDAVHDSVMEDTRLTVARLA